MQRSNADDEDGETRTVRVRGPRARGGGRGGRGGARGGGANKKSASAAVSQDDLDAQLDEYMGGASA